VFENARQTTRKKGRWVCVFFQSTGGPRSSTDELLDPAESLKTNVCVWQRQGYREEQKKRGKEWCMLYGRDNMTGRKRARWRERCAQRCASVCVCVLVEDDLTSIRSNWERAKRQALKKLLWRSLTEAKAGFESA